MKHDTLTRKASNDERHAPDPSRKRGKSRLPSRESVLVDDAMSLVTYDPMTNRVYATSLEVADRYSKQHNYVIKRIERHIQEEAEDRGDVQTSLDISSPDFAKFEGVDGMNRPLEMYAMTRTGFMHIAMGFTGSEARAWRRKFIAAFNHYEAIALRVSLNMSDPERLALREEGKVQRRELAAVLAELRMAFTVVKREDSKADEHIFDNYTRMVQKALFKKALPKKCNLRDWLTKTQLRNLQTVEEMVARFLRPRVLQVLDGTLDYHDLYKEAKSKVLAMVEDFLGGVTEVVDLTQALVFPQKTSALPA
jgi:Rha family phage regulatory protein